MEAEADESENQHPAFRERPSKGCREWWKHKLLIERMQKTIHKKAKHASTRQLEGAEELMKKYETRISQSQGSQTQATWGTFVILN